MLLVVPLLFFISLSDPHNVCCSPRRLFAFLLAAAPEIMQIDQGLYGVAITAFVTVIHVASSPKYVFELKKIETPRTFATTITL